MLMCEGGRGYNMQGSVAKASVCVNYHIFPQDRDITEKIALGQAAPGQTELYDQRLFNASSGLDSG